jgi:SAM-dependent methyltransferase/uncharacterized protein YbaR (Trm112 family)
LFENEIEKRLLFSEKVYLAHSDMGIGKKLEGLVCPDCRADLATKGSSLQCPTCSTEFPIVEGIPVVMPARHSALVEFTALDIKVKEGERSPTRYFVGEARSREFDEYFFRQMFPKLNRDDPQWRFLCEQVRGVVATTAAKGGRILDVGAGDCRYRGLFPSQDYIGFDFAQSGDNFSLLPLDVVADALAIPFRAESFDFVLNMAVMEHVPDPFLAATEMARVLKRGGRCFCLLPLTRPEHMAPFDFFRFTKFGAERVFTQAGFAVRRIDPSNGKVWTLIYYLRQALAMLPIQYWENRKLIGRVLSGIVRLAISPLVMVGRLFPWLGGKDMPIYYFIEAERK